MKWLTVLFVVLTSSHLKIHGQNIIKQPLTYQHEINLSIQIAQNTINPIFKFDFPPIWQPTFTVYDYLNYLPFHIELLVPDTQNPPNLILPDYTQGKFCDFEDYINRKRKMRIDFSVK